MTDYPINAVEIGNRIKELRRRQGKTQTYFADMLYISSSYLALIEAGKRVPTIEILAQIAKISGVSLDYLVFGDESNMNAPQLTLNRLRQTHSPDKLQKALQIAEFYLSLEETSQDS